MNLTYHTVDTFCQEVDLGAAKPTIDMGNISFIEPFALIYLSLFIRSLNEAGILLRGRHPKSQRVKKYLEAQNFWTHNRFMHRPQFPTTNLTSFNSIVEISPERYIGESIGDDVLRVLESNPPRAYRNGPYLVAELVSELVDNFAQHSESESAYCALQLYPQVKRLDFAIGDNGIGIRQSLSQNPLFQGILAQPHSQAALKALERNVTRRHEGGMGLTEVHETVVQELGGQIFLSTGDGWVYSKKGDDEVSFGTQAYNLSGVQVEISIPLGGPR